MAERGKHPEPKVLRDFARAHSVPDAGLLLHALDCARCAAIVRKILAPKPVRRRRTAEARD